jgi:D-alanyl-D-alanine carboxypeptidase
VVFVSGQTIKWKNTNLLLSPEEGFYRGDAIGMKTGFTRQAEYCLMSAFKCQDGRTVVIGSFGCDDEYDRLRDILKLIKACQAQLKVEGTQQKAG